MKVRKENVEAAGSTSLKADLPGDLDSEPSSSSFIPVPDLKAIGAVCYQELGNEGV